MVNVNFLHSFKVFCAAALLCIFTINATAPIFIPIESNATVVDMGFLVYRVKNIGRKYQKISDGKNKNKHMIDLAIFTVAEVEGMTGKKFDMDAQFALVEKEMKAKGHKVDKKQFKLFKKSYYKRYNKSMQLRTHLLMLDASGKDYNQEEEIALFEEIYGKDYDSDEYAQLDLHTCIAIVSVLGGICLISIEAAPAVVVTAGWWLIDAGMVTIVHGRIDQFSDWYNAVENK